MAKLIDQLTTEIRDALRSEFLEEQKAASTKSTKAVDPAIIKYAKAKTAEFEAEQARKANLKINL